VKPSRPSSVRHMTPHSGMTLETVTLDNSLPIGMPCSIGVVWSGSVGLDKDRI